MVRISLLILAFVGALSLFWASLTQSKPTEDRPYRARVSPKRIKDTGRSFAPTPTKQISSHHESEVLSAVQHLDSVSYDELMRMYEQARTLIKNDPDLFDQFAKTYFKNIENRSVLGGFFLVDCALRFSPRAEPLLLSVLKQVNERKPSELDWHHSLDRLYLLQSFTLAQMVDIRLGTKKSTNDQILKIAKTHPDLAVAREAIKWLSVFEPQSIWVETVVSSRPRTEWFAFEDLI